MMPWIKLTAGGNPCDVSPVCQMNEGDLQSTGIGSSVDFATIVTAIGLPIMIVGIVKNRRYNEWRKSQGMAGRFLEGLSLSASGTSPGLSWRLQF